MFARGSIDGGFYASVSAFESEKLGYLRLLLKIFDLQVVERFVPFTVSHGTRFEEMSHQNMTAKAINYKFAQKICRQSSIYSTQEIFGDIFIHSSTA